MHTTYGRTPLTEKVATKEDLEKMVICTDKLPDISDVVEGAVIQLTGLQSGYITTHLYRADTKSGTWVDITSSEGSIITPISDVNASCESVTPTEWPQLPYVRFKWTRQLPSDVEKSTIGDLIYSAIVRKNGQYPINLNDGQTVVKIPKDLQTTDVCEYVYGDRGVLDVYEGDHPIDYKYAIYHVYQSGNVKFVRL
jgi:hypothetical protein